MAPRNKFTREEMVEAAVNVVREKGIDALTAKALASELGVSTPPVFTCFHTIEEAKRADLILVVVDSTDKNKEKQIEVVEQVLSEIDANSTKKLYIYNKIDKISDQDEIPSGENIVKISAKRNIGIDTLKQKILSLLWED